jgi:hypothetical protein
VGQLDQFAKQMFAEETEQVTGGAVRWQLPPELNLSEVRLDGLLLVRDHTPLAALPAPWSEIGADVDELILEIKLAGDHVDMLAVQRAALRRQARQVQRGEDAAAPHEGEIPLWIAAPHLPRILGEKRSLWRIAPGCYHVGPTPFPFLWIAANELPLHEALLPFLLLRSGRALDELCLWMKERRPPLWLARVVEFLPMSVAVYDELIRWVSTRTEDPEMNARKRRAVRIFLETTPEVRGELLDEGRLEGRLVGERSMLRRALTHRKLTPSPEEEARIDACADPATLERWLEQAMDAESVAEALR